MWHSAAVAQDADMSSSEEEDSQDEDAAYFRNGGRVSPMPTLCAAVHAACLLSVASRASLETSLD